MSNSRNQIIGSADPGDRQALGILDGKLPVTFDIVERGPVDIEEIAKAEVTLAMANRYHAAGAHREAFMLAVRAAREMLQAVGSPDDSHAPLKHLFDSLLDIDERGIVDPALYPSVRMKGEPSSEWCARAGLALAMEARIRRGEDRKTAAQGVRQQIVIDRKRPKTDWSGAEKILTEWRDLFKKNKAPSGAPVWEGGLIAFERFETTLTPADQLGAFSEAERRLLEQAQEFRDRRGF